jgi:hypothetical protein
MILSTFPSPNFKALAAYFLHYEKFENFYTNNYPKVMNGSALATKQSLEIFSASDMDNLNKSFREICRIIKENYPSYDMFPKTKELCNIVKSLSSDRAIVEQGENLLYICSKIVPISHFTFGLFALDCMDSIAEHLKFTESYYLNVLDFAENKDDWVSIVYQETQQQAPNTFVDSGIQNNVSSNNMIEINFQGLADQAIIE